MTIYITIICLACQVGSKDGRGKEEKFTVNFRRLEIGEWSSMDLPVSVSHIFM